jgi:hypothetical protein
MTATKTSLPQIASKTCAWWSRQAAACRCREPRVGAEGFEWTAELE